MSILSACKIVINTQEKEHKLSNFNSFESNVYFLPTFVFKSNLNIARSGRHLFLSIFTVTFFTFISRSRAALSSSRDFSASSDSLIFLLSKYSNQFEEFTNNSLSLLIGISPRYHLSFIMFCIKFVSITFPASRKLQQPSFIFSLSKSITTQFLLRTRPNSKFAKSDPSGV